MALLKLASLTDREFHGGSNFVLVFLPHVTISRRKTHFSVKMALAFVTSWRVAARTAYTCALTACAGVKLYKRII